MAQTVKRPRTTQDDKNADPNIFTILVATDLHVGYAERDPIRGNDSFEAFEEVLKYAAFENVDFVLCGVLMKY